MKKSLVRIASFANVQQARIFVSILNGSGIPAEIFNEHILSANPGMGEAASADIMIQSSDQKMALELLKEFDSKAGAKSPS